MNLKNRYYRRSTISEAKFRSVLRCFALDLTATDTAELTGLSIRSINPLYLQIHHRLAVRSWRPGTGCRRATQWWVSLRSAPTYSEAVTGFK